MGPLGWRVLHLVGLPLGEERTWRRLLCDSPETAQVGSGAVRVCAGSTRPHHQAGDLPCCADALLGPACAVGVEWSLPWGAGSVGCRVSLGAQCTPGGPVATAAFLPSGGWLVRFEALGCPCRRAWLVPIHSWELSRCDADPPPPQERPQHCMSVPTQQLCSQHPAVWV